MTYEEYVQALLGAMLNSDPAKMPEAINSIKPEYFENHIDRKLFMAMLAGERDLFKLKKITFDKASGLIDMQTRANDYWLSNAMILEFRDFVLDNKIESAYNKRNYEEIRALMMEKASATGRDFIQEYLDNRKEFSEISEEGLLGASTGIKSLDDATLGFMPNHIWVCGAYYGYGKTYFAINTINSMLEQGKRCLFFTLEMTSSEIIQRLVALRAGLTLIQVVGKLDEETLKKRDEAEAFIFEAIKSDMLVIDDSSNTLPQIVSKMSVEDSKGHLDFVALDYIQLLSGKDQYESLRVATKELQQTTKQIHCTTLILSQVSNDSQKAGISSNVDGFKGAGDIGQIANVALKIVRERDMETGEFSEKFDLRLTKVRHSKPCSLHCNIAFPGGKIEEDFFYKDEESLPEAGPSKAADEFTNMFAGL